jgi:hypothetical protein
MNTVMGSSRLLRPRAQLSQVDTTRINEKHEKPYNFQC